jgi:di/tricarboxylate transporter
MDQNVILILIIILAAIVLFATEIISIDLTAMVIMVTLMLTGLVTPEEGIEGFSNTATVTILALFILSAGLQSTGAVNLLGRYMIKLVGRSKDLALAVILVVVGVVSAFINNTAVVVIFMPIVFRIAKFTNSSPARFLMPLSFAAMIGGACTVIGTSTNILVSEIYTGYQVDQGLEPTGFGIFEFAGLGSIILLVFFFYMYFLGNRLIKTRDRQQDLTSQYALKDFLTEIIITKDSPLAGKFLRDTFLKEEIEAEILEISNRHENVWLPSRSELLQEGDRVLLKVNAEDILKIQDEPGVAIVSRAEMGDVDLQSKETTLVEVIVAPNSKVVRKKVKEVDFRNVYGAVPLAIRRRGTYLRKSISDVVLRFGDDVLLEARKESLPTLEQTFDFILTHEIDRPVFNRRKLILSVLIVFAVVVVASFGIQSILVTSLTGCVLMFLTDCITIREAYRNVEWKIIFLLAGLIPLGTAIVNTGAADLIASNISSSLGQYGPTAVVAVLFIITSMLTSIMSNNATAILLAPIAIGLAAEMQLPDPKAFLITIMFAANTSFITPVGYQTNTLIYGPGNYRFADFFKVGGILTIIIWVLVTLIVSTLYL